METSKSVRKRANTRQRLLDAAVDVFIAKGFAGTRIDDVVKEAGFTRGPSTRTTHPWMNSCRKPS